MTYKGQFEAVNGTVYEVSIITQSQGAEQTLTMSSQPVIIEYSAEDAYKPLMLSSCTVTVLSASLLSDMYAALAHDVSCTIRELTSGKIIWTGYATPAAYNQDYLGPEDYVEIEFVDDLSTLSEFAYSTDKKSVVTFMDVIKKAVAKSGGRVAYIYASRNSDYNLEGLYISEQNWYDEDNEAMTYKECLEEIMRYLGMTMLLHGGNIYVIDRDMIRANRSDYVRYSPANDFATATMLSYSDECNIDELTNYAGASISMSEVLDRVGIRSSLYLTENIIDNPLEKEGLSIAGAEESGDDLKDGKWVTQRLSSKTWEPVYYTADASGNFTQTGNRTEWGPDFIRWITYMSADGRPVKNNWNYGIGVTYAFNGPVPKKFLNRPILKYKKSEPNAYSNIYFSIGAEFYATWKNCPWKSDKANKNLQAFIGRSYMRLSFRIGNHYWNGSSWQTTACTFDAGMEVSDKTYEAIKSWDWFSTRNDNVYGNNTPDLKGCIIKVEANQVIVGDIEIQVYAPYILYADYDFPPRLIIRDLEISQQSPRDDTDTVEQDKDTDTLYEKMLREDSVARKEDTDLKVTTNTDKGFSFSAVLIKESWGDMAFLDVMHSVPLAKTQTQELNLLDKYINYYSVPNRIIEVECDGLVAPHARISESGQRMCVGSVTYDLYNNTSNLTLI